MSSRKPTLTRAAIGAMALPEGKSEASLWCNETRGLCVRLRGGEKAFFVKTVVDGKTKKRRVGSAEKNGLSIEAARKKAKALLEAIETEAKLKDAQPPSKPFADAVAAFLAHQERKGCTAKHVQEQSYHLKQHCAPHFGDLEVRAIDRARVSGVVQGVVDAGKPIVAGKVRTTLATFFAFCGSQGWCDHDPVRHSLKGDKPLERQRVLSENELRSLFAALDCRRDFDAIVLLAALLGRRIGEVADLPWSELDLDAGLWHLPASRDKGSKLTKGKRKERLPGQGGHLLPLPEPALKLLRQWPRLDGKPTVFGEAGNKPGRGFQGLSNAMKGLRARVTMDADRRAWTPQDLRRTFSTWSNEHSPADAAVVEACIGHFLQGVAGVYNTAQYVAGKRKVFDAWSDHLASLGLDVPDDLFERNGPQAAPGAAA